MNERYTHIDLFSGIGGFALAAIKDDALRDKVAGECLSCNEEWEVIDAYRAALMERINAKENPNG